MVPDADKKGLPRVVDSLFVSSKTKQNIRVLCNLLYRTAYDIRTANSKERLLDQKIPASYLALEKVISRSSLIYSSLLTKDLKIDNLACTIIFQVVIFGYFYSFRLFVLTLFYYLIDSS